MNDLGQQLVNGLTPALQKVHEACEAFAASLAKVRRPNGWPLRWDGN